MTWNEIPKSPLLGTITEVATNTPDYSMAEMYDIRLTYADGRTVYLRSTGWEADGIVVAALEDF